MNEILTKDRRSRPAAFAATLAVLFLLACAATAGVRAQSPADDSPRPSRERPARPGREAAAPALVRALNLSAEQRAEIARIRREVAPQTRDANLRARRARLALDEAIYAEADDETLIERRAAELAEAEGARARLRARTELRIRRLLTPEQLKAFRELRLRALARRERLRDARPARQRRLRRDAAQPSPPAGPADDDPEPDAAPPPRQSPQTRRPPRRDRRDSERARKTTSERPDNAPRALTPTARAAHPFAHLFLAPSETSLDAPPPFFASLLRS